MRYPNADYRLCFTPILADAQCRRLDQAPPDSVYGLTHDFRVARPEVSYNESGSQRKPGMDFGR